MTDDLLRPSLTDGEQASILSTGALIAAAFFGGTIAVVIVATLNSYYLGRLQGQWPALVLLFVVGATVFYLLATYLLDGVGDSRSFRLAMRGGGFVACAIAWLLHKNELRAISSLGVEPRKPWAPVIAACLFAMAIHLYALPMLS